MSAIAPSHTVTVAASMNGHNRRTIIRAFPPTAACHTLVAAAGMVSRAIAVVRSRKIASSPRLTVGRPRPMTPLIPPAKRNTSAMAAMMNGSVMAALRNAPARARRRVQSGQLS